MVVSERSAFAAPGPGAAGREGSGRRGVEVVRSGSESHEARKALFQSGIRRGWVHLAEIERALPSGSLSPPERWLLFYSLRAAGVEIRDGGDAVRGGLLPREPPVPGA